MLKLEEMALEINKLTDKQLMLLSIAVMYVMVVRENERAKKERK